MQPVMSTGGPGTCVKDRAAGGKGRVPATWRVRPSGTIDRRCGRRRLFPLVARLEENRRAPVVVAVAGMGGALFRGIAGLVLAPVSTVPPSNGVGANVGADGEAILRSALCGCLPSIFVVNIDSGFDGAVAAVKILGARHSQLEPRGLGIASAAQDLPTGGAYDSSGITAQSLREVK
jgi:hypothetical protein